LEDDFSERSAVEVGKTRQLGSGAGENTWVGCPSVVLRTTDEFSKVEGESNVGLGGDLEIAGCAGEGNGPGASGGGVDRDELSVGECGECDIHILGAAFASIWTGNDGGTVSADRELDLGRGTADRDDKVGDTTLLLSTGGT